MSKKFEMNNIDVQKFVEALDKCKGNVYLVTEENDHFNLKSKLSQLAGVLKASIVCDDPEDESMLFRMNLFG
jgi:hypothetical protein